MEKESIIYEQKEFPVRYRRVESPDELNLLHDVHSSTEERVFSYDDHGLAKMKELLGEKHAFQVIATKSDRVAGYIASAETIFPDYQFLAELLVQDEFKGQGIASRLVGQVLEFAKSEGLRGVMTETESDNIPAQRLYEKCGFKRVDNLDWNEGITYKLEFDSTDSRPVSPEHAASIHFLNQPRLSGHEADRKFDERRERLVPEIKSLIETSTVFAGKEVTAEFAHTGVSSLVVFVVAEGQRYVLKVPLSLTDGNGEGRFLRAWESAGVKVPHVYDDGQLGEHPYVLMEYVDAPLLIDRIEDGTAPDSAWTEMGATLACMHTVPAEGFGRIVNGRPQHETFKDWLLSEGIAKRIRYVKENGLLGDDHGSIDEALEILLAYGEGRPHSTLCHFDYSPPNILATEPLTVFDPSPMLSHGVIDLGRSIIATTFMGHPEETELVKEGYMDASSEFNAQALQAAILLNAYWKFPYQHKKGQDSRMDRAREYLAGTRYNFQSR